MILCFTPSIVFSSIPRLPLIAVAYLEGTLAVYDLSTQVLRHSFRHEVKRSQKKKLVAIAEMTQMCRFSEKNFLIKPSCHVNFAKNAFHHFSIRLQAESITCVCPSGRHCPPAVGGFFFCGVHLLPGRSTAAVGRPLRPDGVRVLRPHCRDPRLYCQQVPVSVKIIEKASKADWSILLFTAFFLPISALRDLKETVYKCTVLCSGRNFSLCSASALQLTTGETLTLNDLFNPLLFPLDREASVAVTASGDGMAKVFCLQRPDR